MIEICLYIFHNRLIYNYIGAQVLWLIKILIAIELEQISLLLLPFFTNRNKKNK